MERKYEHLTSGHNYNNVTASVRDSIAPQVDAALSYLLESLPHYTKSQIICDGILALAASEGFVFGDENAQANSTT